MLSKVETLDSLTKRNELVASIYSLHVLASAKEPNAPMKVRRAP